LDANENTQNRNHRRDQKSLVQINIVGCSNFVKDSYILSDISWQINQSNAAEC
jgi:ABC-type molybdenum transport system ATPase subunit/photorepair protein PhrA